MTRKWKAVFLAAVCPMILLNGCGEKSSSEIPPAFGSSAAPAETGSVPSASSVPDSGAAAAEDVLAERKPKTDAFASAYALTVDGASDANTQNHGQVIAPERDDSQPFVLTAGEWNDLDNWGFFLNLCKTGTVKFPVYGLEPANCVSVTLTHDGEPVPNQTVQLHGTDMQLWWETKTDRNGRAYLFYPTEDEARRYLLTAAGASTVEFEIPAAPADAAEGQGNALPQPEYEFECNTAGQKYDRTEVMFILDTTGSMGDEISYLQKDFASIAGEVGDENMRFSVNFYRDEGDEYVTKCNPFTSDVQEVQRLLNAEYADGGGDSPEAVTEILSETMKRGDWSQDTNKIAFLIFDAPPHGNPYDADADYSELISSVIAAAAQGVHLVPVVASNAERETELFGRACAIMTNSNYVFLTDDSGVGDSHLEPIIGDYDVELLHDIIVRNIRAAAQ